MLDKAISLSRFLDGFKIFGKVSIKSNKLILSKCENFPEFIFSNGMKDAAHGNCKLG